MSAEQEPYLPIQWGDKEIKMTAYNSKLYTFLGRSSITAYGETFDIDNSAINHVWVFTKKNKGMYFWEEYHPEEYKTMAAFIIQHQFPALLNSRDLLGLDVQSWIEIVNDDVANFASELPDAPDL